MAEPLATVDDVAARLGRDLTAAEETRVETLVVDASAAVRSYTGQTFSAETTTDRLRVKAGTVRLPQRPVTDVTEVTDLDGNDLAFTWYHGDSITLAGVPANGWVDVTYEHGWEELPADIVAVVCQIVGRALGTPADQGGYQSETIGNYTYAIGAAAAAGATGMMNDERAALDRYRRIGGSAWMAI